MVMVSVPHAPCYYKAHNINLAPGVFFFNMQNTLIINGVKIIVQESIENYKNLKRLRRVRFKGNKLCGQDKNPKP